MQTLSHAIIRSVGARRTRNARPPSAKAVPEARSPKAVEFVSPLRERRPTRSRQRSRNKRRWRRDRSIGSFSSRCKHAHTRIQNTHTHTRVRTQALAAFEVGSVAVPSGHAGGCGARRPASLMAGARTRNANDDPQGVRLFCLFPPPQSDIRGEERGGGAHLAGARNKERSGRKAAVSSEPAQRYRRRPQRGGLKNGVAPKPGPAVSLHTSARARGNSISSYAPP